MNLNASSGPTRWRDPSRIGQVRPSHLVTTAGVGSVVDLPTMSVIVRSLDAWSAERQETIEEPRLLTEVQRVLGQQVRALRKAPWDPSESDDPYTRVGFPSPRSRAGYAALAATGLDHSIRPASSS